MAAVSNVFIARLDADARTVTFSGSLTEKETIYKDALSMCERFWNCLASFFGCRHWEKVEIYNETDKALSQIYVSSVYPKKLEQSGNRYASPKPINPDDQFLIDELMAKRRTLQEEIDVAKRSVDASVDLLNQVLSAKRRGKPSIIDKLIQFKNTEIDEIDRQIMILRNPR